MMELNISHGLLEGFNKNKCEFHQTIEGDLLRNHGIRYYYDSHIPALINFCFNVSQLVINFRLVIFCICIRSSHERLCKCFPLIKSHCIAYSGKEMIL